MSTAVPTSCELNIPRGARIAVIAARFNAQIVDELLSGCTTRLKELGAKDQQVEVFRVPGAFELPVAAKAAARAGRFNAVICLGCVIRGDTPHFDYVAGEAARGIQQVAIEQSLPIIFGVLTTETEQQAKDRTGGSHGHAGQRAAEAAAEMIALLGDIAGRTATKSC
jgi:6,7-dimethyl-8-ribityllumazine synthase